MSSAATTIVGAAALGARHWLPRASFALAALMCVSCAPAELFFVLSDAAISPGADVALLAAPCSINAVAFSALRRAAGSDFVFDAPTDRRLGHALVGLASIFATVAVGAALRRRATIRPFSLAWAGIRAVVNFLGPRPSEYPRGTPRRGRTSTRHPRGGAEHPRGTPRWGRDPPSTTAPPPAREATTFEARRRTVGENGPENGRANQPLGRAGREDQNVRRPA